MRRILGTALVLLAVAGTPSLASPPPPQISDATGDALTGKASDDIVAVHLRRTPGRKSTFDVTMTLAAPPDAGTPVKYAVFGRIGAECHFAWHWTSGQEPTDMQFARCGSDNGSAPSASGAKYYYLYVEPKVQGRSITWSMRMSAAPKDFRLGATIHELYATTVLSDPMGNSPFDALGPIVSGDFDRAVADEDYVIR